MLTPTDMLTNMVSIAARITALELAVVAVARQEFGDSPGHPFRGNQYSGGGGSKETVGHATAVAKLVDSGRYPNGDAARAAIENQMKDVHPNDRETVMNMMVNGVRDPVQSLGEHRDENASAVMDTLAPTGTGTSGDESPREAGYDEGIMRANEAYTYVGGEVSNPTALRQDAEADLETARSDLNSTAEPGSPFEEAATYNEASAEAQIAFHQEMEKADGYMRPDMTPAAQAEPEQRHGLAQDKHSYDSDDVETFSIDDDGTVTFGDAPGHPFRGNQYGPVPTGRSRDTGEGSGLREVQLKDPRGATSYAEQGSKAHDDAMRNLDEQRFPKSVLKSATDEQLHQLHRDVKDANGRNTWAESDRFSRRTANALDTRETWIKDELNRRGVEPQAQPYQPNQAQGTRD